MKREPKRKTYTVITKCFDMIGRMDTYEGRKQAESAMRSRALAVAETGGLKEVCGKRNSHGFYRYDVKDKKSGACLFTARLVATERQGLLIEDKQITIDQEGENDMEKKGNENTNMVTDIVATGTQTAPSATDWGGLVATFISSQDVKESSRELYARTLTQFFKWIGETGKSLANLTRVDILEYKDNLQAKGLSPLTVGSYIVSVRKFYEWSESEKLYPNIAKGVKTPRRKPLFRKQHLTDKKSGELLQHFQDLSLRDYAIVNLILRTGLRTVEVVRADIGDITFKGERRVLKVWGKGRDEKDDFVVLSDKAYLPIAAYLGAARRGARDGEPLFASTSHRNNGGRLTTRTISGLCKDGLRAIGYDTHEYTAHSLRHTAAVAILKHGGNITDVQSVLRHSSPVTSQIYTESVKEEMRLQEAPELMIDEAF